MGMRSFGPVARDAHNPPATSLLLIFFCFVFFVVVYVAVASCGALNLRTSIQFNPISRPLRHGTTFNALAHTHSHSFVSICIRVCPLVGFCCAFVHDRVVTVYVCVSRSFGFFGGFFVCVCVEMEQIPSDIASAVERCVQLSRRSHPFGVLRLLCGGDNSSSLSSSSLSPIDYPASVMRLRRCWFNAEQHRGKSVRTILVIVGCSVLVVRCWLMFECCVCVCLFS